MQSLHLEPSGRAVNPPTRMMPVALSVEAQLLQWARQSGAPAGAGVVAETEIAARLRGVEWRTPEAVAVSVLARPRELAPDSVDLVWLAAGLATVEALETLGVGRWCCQWPDRIVCEPDVSLDVVVSANCTLAVGRIDLALLTARVGPLGSPPQRSRLTDALLEQLRTAGCQLEATDSLVSRYRDRCVTVGQAVELRMLPHGTIRGTATDIDNTGRLVLASPTGLREPIAVATLNSIRLLTDGAVHL